MFKTEQGGIMSGWEIILIRLVVLPVLKNIADLLVIQTKKTPDKTDDIVAGMFKSIVAFLEDPTILTKIGKGK